MQIWGTSTTSRNGRDKFSSIDCPTSVSAAEEEKKGKSGSESQRYIYAFRSSFPWKLHFKWGENLVEEDSNPHDELRLKLIHASSPRLSTDSTLQSDKPPTHSLLSQIKLLSIEVLIEKQKSGKMTSKSTLWLLLGKSEDSAAAKKGFLISLGTP